MEAPSIRKRITRSGGVRFDVRFRPHGRAGGDYLGAGLQMEFVKLERHQWFEVADLRSATCGAIAHWCPELPHDSSPRTVSWYQRRIWEGEASGVLSRDFRAPLGPS